MPGAVCVLVRCALDTSALTVIGRAKGLVAVAEIGCSGFWACWVGSSALSVDGLSSLVKPQCEVVSTLRWALREALSLFVYHWRYNASSSRVPGGT